MKRYVGERTEEGVEVIILDDEGGQEPLNPRRDLQNRTPDKFDWGHGGSGPAQLALALLADALGDDEKAQEFYQDFKFKVIARLADDTFDLSVDEIRQKVAELETKRGIKR